MVKMIDYTKGEEIFSGVSHITGAGIGLVGTLYLCILSVLKSNVLSLVCSSVYGGTMMILYTVSALYHMLPQNRAKLFFRIMDHNCIFLLIAGTYTPFSLLGLGGVRGVLLCAFNWLLAVVGVLFNSINLERFKIPSMICYILMGWSVMITIRPLFVNIGNFAFFFLLGGGIAYTGGIIFYAVKKRYFHSVWHLFVLLGSVLQFVSIVDIVNKI